MTNERAIIASDQILNRLRYTHGRRSDRHIETPTDHMNTLPETWRVGKLFL